MRILLINNKSKYLPALKKLLKKENLRVIRPQEIDFFKIDNFDLIILSGGHHFSVMGHQEKYKKEINLVKNSKKPILGICLGFQLIARAFEGKLVRLPRKKKGLIEIKILQKDKIFKNLPNFKVYESHRWALKELPPDLIGLASSKNGFEVIKHKNRTIYGFQFHPEMFLKRTCGDEIFYNFFNLVKEKVLK